MSIEKPMLAATIESPDDLDHLLYPVFASPKLDGVRCVTDSSATPHSRKGELFENPYIVELMGRHEELEDLDGELGIGNPTDKEFFTRTSAWLRRSDDTNLPEPITFWVFDRVDAERSYQDRFVEEPTDYTVATPELVVRKLVQILCRNKQEVLDLEQKWFDEGYEGIMLRGAIYKASYKHGRASMNSQQLMKYKRFADTEGVLIGFVEGKTNNNEATKDALGHTKRSSAKAGKTDSGRVGALLVQSPDFAETVKIGTGIGLTHQLRTDMLENPDKYLGRTVTFTYQPGSDYVKARFPSFKGFRDDGI